MYQTNLKQIYMFKKKKKRDLACGQSLQSLGTLGLQSMGSQRIGHD